VARPSSRVGRLRSRAIMDPRGMIIVRQSAASGGNRTRLMTCSILLFFLCSRATYEHWSMRDRFLGVLWRAAARQ
jgi:hypothetical protein